MAQKIQTLFIDDVDGSEARGTVRFGLDGAEYEIDLNKKHEDDLREILTRHTVHARKVGGAPVHRRSGAPTPRSGDGKAHRTAEREWHRGQGRDVKRNGRIPAAWHAEYVAYLDGLATPAAPPEADAVPQGGAATSEKKGGDLTPAAGAVPFQAAAEAAPVSVKEERQWLRDNNWNPPTGGPIPAVMHQAFLTRTSKPRSARARTARPRSRKQ